MARSSSFRRVTSLICDPLRVVSGVALAAVATTAVLPAARAASVIPEESYCEFGCSLPELDDPMNGAGVRLLLPIGGFETNPFRKFVPVQRFIQPIGMDSPSTETADPARPQDASRPAP